MCGHGPGLFRAILIRNLGKGRFHLRLTWDILETLFTVMRHNFNSFTPTLSKKHVTFTTVNSPSFVLLLQSELLAQLLSLVQVVLRSHIDGFMLNQLFMHLSDIYQCRLLHEGSLQGTRVALQPLESLMPTGLWVLRALQRGPLTKEVFLVTVSSTNHWNAILNSVLTNTKLTEQTSCFCFEFIL